MYRSLNAKAAHPKNCPFGANTTIGLKKISQVLATITELPSSSGVFFNSQACRYIFFFISIVVLTPNGQFLGYATTAFSERYQNTSRPTNEAI